MRTKHGFKYISSIPTDAIGITHESWREHANKERPSDDDRAKIITYRIPEIGTITMSHTSGTITIDSSYEENGVKRQMQKWLGKSAYEMFEKNFICEEVGAHFRKFHGTVGFELNVKEAGKYPMFISVRTGKNYFDIHIRFPKKGIDIDNLSKKDYTPTSSPKRKYVSDIEIMNLVKEKGVVSLSDGSALNLSESAFYRRLEKLTEKGILVRTEKRPALYMLKPSNKYILQNLQEMKNGEDNV